MCKAIGVLIWGGRRGAASRLVFFSRSGAEKEQEKKPEGRRRVMVPVEYVMGASHKASLVTIYYSACKFHILYNLVRYNTVAYREPNQFMHKRGNYFRYQERYKRGGRQCFPEPNVSENEDQTAIVPQ